MTTTSPSGFSKNSAGSGKGWSVSRMLRGSAAQGHTQGCPEPGSQYFLQILRQRS